MGKMKLSSKLKEVLVDEEVSLSVINNQEFVAVRATEKLWLVPTTIEDQLHDLVKDGLIQEKDFTDWKVLGQHRVPTPSPSEIVLFISFVQASLCFCFSLSFPSLFRHFSEPLDFERFSSSVSVPPSL
jgi:hypothetical protein